MRGRAQKSFNVGDFVFAKVKGFRPWPGKVMQVVSNKYCVFYYGTRNLSLRVKPADLFNYHDTKDKYGEIKSARRDFLTALREIEAAVAGTNDVSPSVENFDPNEEIKKKVDVDEDDLDEHDEQEPVKVVTPKKEKMILVKPEKQETSAVQVIQPAQKPKAPLRAKQEKQEPKAIEVVQSSQTVSNRRGKRKIETYAEIDPADVPVPKKRGPKKKVSKIPLRPIAKLQRSDIHTVENKIAYLNNELKRALNPEEAPDCQFCFDTLNEIMYLTQMTTPIMLKKNPGVVDVMNKLKRYVGNTSNWTMTAAEKRKFEENAKTLRDYAEEIFEEFKKLFGVKDSDKEFLQKFATEVEEFEEKIQFYDFEFKANICFDADIPDAPPNEV